MSKYTQGEILALCAPLLECDMAHVEHMVIVAQLRDGVIRSVGCQHRMMLMIETISRHLEQDSSAMWQIPDGSLDDC